MYLFHLFIQFCEYYFFLTSDDMLFHQFTEMAKCCSVIGLQALHYFILHCVRNIVDIILSEIRQTAREHRVKRLQFNNVTLFTYIRRIERKVGHRQLCEHGGKFLFSRFDPFDRHLHSMFL